MFVVYNSSSKVFRSRIFSSPKRNKDLQRKVQKRKLRKKTAKVFKGLKFLGFFTKLLRGPVMLWVVLIGMAAFILFATFSHYFLVKKITIERDNPFLNTVEIDATLEDFYGRNLIFFPDSDLVYTLQENFPEIRDVTIREVWPNELELTIRLSPPLFMVFNNETANFSVLSDDGVILGPGSEQDLPVLKLFQYDRILQARDILSDKATLVTMQKGKRLLEEEFELPVKNMHFLYKAREVHYILEKGETAIWVDLVRPLEPQLKKLSLAADELGLYSKNIQHIDLRIPNQIFWEDK